MIVQVLNCTRPLSAPRITPTPLTYQEDKKSLEMLGTPGSKNSKLWTPQLAFMMIFHDASLKGHLFVLPRFIDDEYVSATLLHTWSS
jgi:hypothetical protein